MIDIAQTIVTTHVTWYYTVENWADPTVFLRDSPWSAATVPLFAGLGEYNNSVFDRIYRLLT